MSEQDAADSGADDTDAHDGDVDADDTDAHDTGSTDRVDDASGAFPFDDADGVEDAGDEFEADEALIERVAEADPESVAHELTALRARVEGLEEQLETREEELEDVTSKLKRKQADFQNYKKRMEKRREQEKERATEDLVERLLDVRDNLARALDQDDPDVEDIRGGVESTLRGFDRVLEEENVTVVEPDPGDEVDPRRHEVLMRVASDQPADAIADVHRPGYVMAEKVLRPAQVTVSDDSGDGSGATGDGGATGEGGSDDEPGATGGDE